MINNVLRKSIHTIEKQQNFQNTRKTRVWLHVYTSTRKTGVFSQNKDFKVSLTRTLRSREHFRKHMKKKENMNKWMDNVKSS